MRSSRLGRFVVTAPAVVLLAVAGTAVAVTPVVAVPLLTASRTAAVAASYGPVRISGASLYPHCTAGAPPKSTGLTDKNYSGDAVEPRIAVNPANPANIAVAFQMDRWEFGGSHAVGIAVSDNGGRQWHTAALPGLTRCQGGSWGRASDPWVSFSPDGTLYASALVDSWSPSSGGYPPSLNTSGVAVFISRDGGRIWSKPQLVVKTVDPSGVQFDDKPAVTADPVRPGYAYVVWDHGVSGSGQPAYFSRTTDDGQTWSTPAPVYNPTRAGGWTLGNQIAVEPDGTLLDVLFQGHGADSDDAQPQAVRDASSRPAVKPVYTNGTVRVVQSTDAGLHWSASVIVGQLHDSYIVDPVSRKPMRTGDIIPDIAVNPMSGQTSVVWQQRTATGRSAIVLSSSTDDGASWTAPVTVSQTPAAPAWGDDQAFTPNVAINAAGTTAVTYYDFSGNGGRRSDSARYWLVSCAGAACTHDTASWRKHLLGGPFDVLRSPFAAGVGPFLGDYMSVTADGSRFLAAFSMARPRPSNPQSIYVAGTTPGG